jgi:hypothetical protein
MRRRTVRSALATSILAAVSLGAAASPAGVRLRYAYKPGQTLLFTIVDDVTSTLTPESGAGIVEIKQHMTGTVRKAVVSATGGSGVVDESVVKGIIERTDSRGTTSQVLTLPTRRYTFTDRGAFVSVERIEADGRKSSKPEPLDGFSFTLPEEPVAPGAKWSGSTSVVGLDGKPISIKSISTYRAAAQRLRHLSDQIDVSFSGTFTTTPQSSPEPVRGTLKGTASYSLARDLGQEVETSSELTISYPLTATMGGKQQKVTRTLRFTHKRALANPPAE